ncbi:MAG: FadR family transcriptional regulator [Verrucomicrobiales bacterium]|nr:FadR family transcriptional regulator [Verrucomicrobiales bacterium]MCP5558253.1 FadR family transcriptional regulator [Verrucomicrobiaceae bacterium]
MLIDAIERPPSLVEKVCQKLAAQIRERSSLPSDEWLPTERDLAASMGVSRSVVREATKRLEQQGLLEIRQGLGIRAVDRLHKPLNGSLELLIPNQTQRLRQLIELRTMLEPELAALAAADCTPAQAIELRQVHEQLVNATSFADRVHADMNFHRTIAKLAGNQIAELVLNSLSELLQAGLKLGYQRAREDNPIKQHATLLEAITRRDPKAAKRAMLSHLRTAATDLGFEPR